MPKILARPPKRITGLRPKPSIVLAGRNGQELRLDARQRSRGALFIGNSGSGKTTAMEAGARQDIMAGRGLCVIDPHGDLYNRLLAFICYRKAIGCHVPDVVLFNPSDGEWVLPFDPFVAPISGDLSAAVDRRVQATLRAWGQQTADETPRLEKWLKVLYTVVMHSRLGILEAGEVLNRQNHALRHLLAARVNEPLISRLVEQLSEYRPIEYLAQTESVENRLMRFLCSDVMRRTMGLGQNALDCRAAMDHGQIVLVNLGLSGCITREQQRLIGTLLFNEFFEAAMQRPTGSRPYYLWIDEAGLFATPEIGQALETCRKKGLHLTLGFQELAQFKAEDLRLYKSVKNNTEVKLVFTIRDRPDAQELADDIFPDLTEPQLKFMRQHLSHLIEDVREKSETKTSGHSRSFGQNESQTNSRTVSTGRSHGRSTGKNQSQAIAINRSRTITGGRTVETSTSQSYMHSEHQAHASGYSETTSQQENSGHNSAETVREREFGMLFGDHERTKTSGQSASRSQSHSRTETGSDSYDTGDSTTESTTTSRGASKSVARMRGDSTSHTHGRSFTKSSEASQSKSVGTSNSRGQSSENGQSHSHSVTDQPGTRHHAFWEQQPEHWSLQERRWQSSELLMRQPPGHCFARTGTELLPLDLIRPRACFILPEEFRRLSYGLYAARCLPQSEADAQVGSRQHQSRMAAAEGRLPGQIVTADGPQTDHSKPRSAEGGMIPDRSLWNRQNGVQVPPQTAAVTPPRTLAGRRGPKPDSASHAKVKKIIDSVGPNWADASN